MGAEGQGREGGVWKRCYFNFLISFVAKRLF